jgi:pimeloyl-ACP methyl ester carboxylesterase
MGTFVDRGIMRIRKKMLAALIVTPVLLGLAAGPSAWASHPASHAPRHKVSHVAHHAAGRGRKKPAQTAFERQVASLPARFTRQKLAWTPCDARVTDADVRLYWRGVRCALLTAPLDYANPAGRTIKIAIDESAATRAKNLGILMTNPGGPGGAGLFMPAQLSNGASSPDALHDNFDIVGMNPRGVGPSTDAWGNNDVKVMGTGATALTCATGDVTYQPPKLPDWASATLRVQAEQAAGQEAACQRTADHIRPYITTMNTARDIDLLRIVLGKQKINYYGVSYGTFLGAMYGAMFPHHLNRMVLDGSMSPKVSWYDESKYDNEAKVGNFAAFAAWAVANKQGLGDTPRAVRATVDRLYADTAMSSPKPLGGYTPAKLAKDVGEFTRYRQDWVAFAASLRNALSAERHGQVSAAITQDVDSASTLVPPPSDINPESDADFSDGVYNAVTCDWAWPKPDNAGYKVYDDNMAYWDRTFPYAGTGPAAGPSACTYLSYRHQEKLPAISARGPYPKGLVVNAAGDTQTPLSMARQMAKTLGFDLVTVTNDGTHGSAFTGNRCVDKAVTNYLVSGKLPGNISCPTINPPGTGMSLTGTATSAASQDGPDGDGTDAARHQSDVLVQQYRLGGWFQSLEGVRDVSRVRDEVTGAKLHRVGNQPDQRLPRTEQNVLDRARQVRVGDLGRAGFGRDAEHVTARARRASGQQGGQVTGLGGEERRSLAIPDHGHRGLGRVQQPGERHLKHDADRP